MLSPVSAITREALVHLLHRHFAVELGFGPHLDTLACGSVELGSGTRASDDDVAGVGNRADDGGARPLGHHGGLLAGHRQCAGEDDDLATEKLAGALGGHSIYGLVTINVLEGGMTIR